MRDQRRLPLNSQIAVTTARIHNGQKMNPSSANDSVQQPPVPHPVSLKSSGSRIEKEF